MCGVKLFFESENTCPAVGYESYDGGHRWIETRRMQATTAIGWLQDLYPQWVGLKSIVAVTTKREGKEKTTEETRYFISSYEWMPPTRKGWVRSSVRTGALKSVALGGGLCL